MKRNLSSVFGLIAILLLLSGCSYLRSKFGPQPDAYKGSAESAPLEIPPGLDKPNTSGTLVIPEPGKPSTSPATSDSVPAAAISAADTAQLGAPPTIAPTAVAASGSGAEAMQVADTVANTWSRVGLALERSGVATIQSRDEKAHTFEIQADGQKTTSPGWFKKAITFGTADGKIVSTPVNLRVRVSGKDGASKVTIEAGASAESASAAGRVMQTLRDRMS